MKRLTNNTNYESLELIQLQKYEDLFEEWLKEYHNCLNIIETLKNEDKQKTVRYKEAFGRKLFLSFILEKAIAENIIKKEDLL